MAHFAQIDENNIVTKVIVVEQEFIDTGILGDPSKWIQTSYNTHGGKHYDPDTRLEDDKTPLRKNYAGIGDIYDSVRDAFYAPQPYPSWTLNENTCWWEPPVAHPDATDGILYNWDEDNQQWIKIEE
jgi:hypothetical protein